jgi:hypothetical protein
VGKITYCTVALGCLVPALQKGIIMANVTQCDVCKDVIKHEESIFLALSKVTKRNELSNTIHEVDLCHKCYEKVCKLLDLEVYNANK